MKIARALTSRSFLAALVGVAGLALLLLSAACGGDDKTKSSGSSGAAGSAVAEDTATATPSRSHRTRNVVLVAAGVLVVAASARAVLKSSGKSGPKPEVVPVTAVAVTQKSVPLTTKAIGNVEAFSTVAIRALVSGELGKIHFKQGQDVSKGDLLFTIDPRPLQAALDQAVGTLAKDKSQLANAHALEVRYKKLFDEGIASKEDWDQYRTSADTSAGLVAADEAAAENARVQLSYATIRSPISGMTGNLLVYEGNLVKANDTTPLVTITQATPIYVTFAVPEGELAKVNRARAAGPVRVEAALPSDEPHPIAGVLSFVDNAVDSTTGTIRLKATFDNAGKRLWPGQFVKVTLTTGIEATKALRQRDLRQYTAVSKEGRPVVTLRIGLF